VADTGSIDKGTHNEQDAYTKIVLKTEAATEQQPASHRVAEPA
jgi:hypothetical protein